MVWFVSKMRKWARKSDSSSKADLCAAGVRTPPSTETVLDWRAPLSFSLEPVYISPVQQWRREFRQNSLVSLLGVSLAPNTPNSFRWRRHRNAKVSCLEKLKIWKESFGKKCKLSDQTINSPEPQPLPNARLWQTQQDTPSEEETQEAQLTSRSGITTAANPYTVVAMCQTQFRAPYMQ